MAADWFFRLGQAGMSTDLQTPVRRGKYRSLYPLVSALFANCVLVASICVLVSTYEVSVLDTMHSNFAPKR